jgi:outer membrane protein assembly factor BamB
MNRRRGIRVGLLALGGAFALLVASHAADWPRWRGPDGTGISAEKDWKPQALAAAKVKWKSSVGQGYAAVSVAGKSLYTIGHQGGNDAVVCLDAESGKELWRYSYPCGPGNNGYQGPRATPVVDGDSVYTLSREGHAFCLEAATGKVKWQGHLARDHKAAPPTWGIAGSPLILGNAVIYNAASHGIALDKSTGQKIWESPPGVGGYAAPVAFTLKGKEAVAIFGMQELFVVDAMTGEKLHAHPWKTQYDVNASDPVAFDGKLFISSGYGHGAALLDFSGKQVKVVWESKEMRCHFASAIYLDGHLFGIDDQVGSGKLKCLDAKTGTTKWTSKKNGYENLMVASGRILAIEKTGELSVVDAGATAFKEVVKGAILGKGPENWPAPVLANGLVYCRNSAGDLVCVDLH